MAGKRRGSRPAPKTPTRRPQGAKAWAKRIALWGAVVALVLSLVGLLAIVVLYKAIDVPDPNAAFETESTLVYYAGGKQELGEFSTQKRVKLSYDEMPQDIKDAVVAMEDQSFWTNKGIDLKGILRAALSNASGNDTQGASTITQQYVKILYLTQEHSYKRKIKEAIIARKLSDELSKEEILEGYLNTIYFGRGAYGIEAAAQTWFRRPAEKLTLGQTAVLASVINNPTLFDPANGEENEQLLHNRMQSVLNKMVGMDKITQAEADEAGAELPKIKAPRLESVNAGQRGHALDLVKKELLRLGVVTEAQINGGGLKVTTTLTKDAMDAAEEGVEQIRPDGKKDLHTAVASVEPGTGALRGFYAGQDYLQSQINWAVSGGSPGSTFKPFTLAAGLEAGYSLKDTFQGDSPFYWDGSGTGDRVRNEGSGPDGLGNDYGKKVNLIKGLEESINTVFADLISSIPDGADEVLDTANALGVPKWDKDRTGLDHLHTSPGLEAVPGITFGFATVAPINMANAYATIANGGEAADVYVIEKVEDSNGEVLYRHRVDTERAIDEDIAADVSYALQQVVQNGTGTAAQAIGRPAAGKTGTATNDDDQVSSSWFVGYTPQLSTAVMYVRGTGNESLEGYLEPFYGATYPAQTWAAVMSRAMEGEPVESFPPPAWVDGEAPEDGHVAEPTKKPKPTKTATEKPTETETPEPSTPTTTTPGPVHCSDDPSDPDCVGPTPEPTPTCTDNLLTPEDECATTPPGNGGGNAGGGDPTGTPSPGARLATESREEYANS